MAHQALTGCRMAQIGPALPLNIIPNWKNNLRVVLVSTRNPLNIGAAARAMANFGFTRLCVVAPYDVAFREARSAVGAAPLLQKAEEFPTVVAAIAECRLVVGTTSVGHRELQHPIRRLEYGARLMLRSLPAAPVALLFGSEKFGLSNEDLSHCDWLMRIPTVGQDLSMNLGQAVALCLYELARDPKAALASPDQIRSASAAELEQITTPTARCAGPQRLRQPSHRDLHGRKSAPPDPPPQHSIPRQQSASRHASPNPLETRERVTRFRRRPNSRPPRRPALRRRGLPGSILHRDSPDSSRGLR